MQYCLISQTDRKITAEIKIEQKAVIWFTGL